MWSGEQGEIHNWNEKYITWIRNEMGKIVLGNSLFRWSQLRNSQPFLRNLRKPPKRTQEAFIKHLLCSRLCDQFFHNWLPPKPCEIGILFIFRRVYPGQFLEHEPWLTSVGTIARTTGYCSHCFHQMVGSTTPESSISCSVLGGTSDWLSLVMCLWPSC